MIAVVDFNYVGARGIAGMLNKATIINPDEEIDMSSFTGIILSGSQDEKLIESESLFLALNHVRVPILGICYGMQIIAELYGGTVQEANKEYGWTGVDLQQDDIFEGYYSRELVVMSHKWGIAKMPEDFNIIGIGVVNDTIAAFKHQTLPIYGVMWHPELGPKRGKTIIENFERICSVVPLLSQDQQ